MNKRGQFFILGAIILALALFVLMVRVNTYEEKILLEDFPDLSKNYNSESIKVVNDALLNSLDENQALSDFTKDYVDYARTLDPNLGFVYVYWDKSTDPPTAVINNYLGSDPITVYSSANVANEPVDTLFADADNSLNDVSLNLGGMEFKKTIPVHVNNFDDSLSEGVFTGKVSLEIGGIFYNIPSDQMTVIAKSASANQVSVDIS